MVKINVLFLLFLLTLGANAQLAPGKYLVEFSDKNNTPFSVNNPEEYLGIRSIERRINQNIPIDVSDLPIDPNYISQVLNLGEIDLVQKSKWFNAIVIDPSDSTVLDEVAALPFVIDVRSSPAIGHEPIPEGPRGKITSASRDFEAYGISLHQIEMLNGHLLHEAGFTGEGMRIGVLDGGFSAANEMEAFDIVMSSGRLIGTYDFVDNDVDVFHGSGHGTRVWSAMASYWPDSIVGSAFDAEYMLFRTENVASEFQLEEINWVAAAEMADSAGVDVLNTSLGYTTFDDSTQSYTYEDMDGQTTYISRAGNIAARKGMLVINSAGNSGAGPWYYIGAPADADSVLAVGAVRADSAVVIFSSRGPTFDGRVKPNVCAQGLQTVMANVDNTVIQGSGTSFSSPVLAGLAACLWQTNPNATNMQVFEAIEQSAHLYQNPNDSMGYGLPNFWAAQIILEDLVLGSVDSIFSGLVINAFPNPFVRDLQLLISDQRGGRAEVEVFDVSGKSLFVDRFTAESGRSMIDLSQSFGGMAAGIYLIEVRLNGQSDLIKVQKRQ